MTSGEEFRIVYVTTHGRLGVYGLGICILMLTVLYMCGVGLHEMSILKLVFKETWQQVVLALGVLTLSIILHELYHGVVGILLVGWRSIGVKLNRVGLAITICAECVPAVHAVLIHLAPALVSSVVLLAVPCVDIVTAFTRFAHVMCLVASGGDIAYTAMLLRLGARYGLARVYILGSEDGKSVVVAVRGL